MPCTPVRRLGGKLVAAALPSCDDVCSCLCFSRLHAARLSYMVTLRSFLNRMFHKRANSSEPADATSPKLLA